jgi:hypothetical protein
MNLKQQQLRRPVRLRKFLGGSRDAREAAQEMGLIDLVNETNEKIYRRVAEVGEQLEEFPVSIQGSVAGDTGFVAGVVYANMLYCEFALVFDIDSSSISPEAAFEAMQKQARECGETIAEQMQECDATCEECGKPIVTGNHFGYHHRDRSS